MKWIFLWIAMTPTGSMTSGSAPFATEQACLAGEQAFLKLMSDMQQSVSRAGGFYPNEMVCLNTETGERKTNRLSLEEAQRRMNQRNSGSPR